jgi:hypothetical protein
LTGNRGFFEIRLVKSEVRSRDAGIAINAHPNGRVSFGLHEIQLGGKRGLHIRSKEEILFQPVCQMVCAAKIALSDFGAVLD